MSIEINVHGANITCDDAATVRVNHVHNIERKVLLRGGKHVPYLEIEVSGGEIQIHDLPDAVIEALVAVTDVING